MRGGRWSEERRATREAVTWLHLLLQERGPLSTPDIVEALRDAGRRCAHELQRPAAQRTRHAVGTEDGPRGKVTVWAWSVEEE